MKFWLILFPAFCFLGKMELPQNMKSNLTLKINAPEEARGSLRIAIFKHEDDFLNTDKAVYLKVLEVNDLQPVEHQVGQLHYGEYAIAIFHDTNNNGRLDTNWLGIPKEPYAFSNDAGKKWKKPSFQDAKVLLDTENRVVRLQLRTWKAR